MNVDDLKSKDVILSLLRILVNNGNMKADFPCFEDTRTFKLSMMFRGSSTLQQLLKAAKDYVTKHTHEIKWPREMKSYEPPMMLRYKDAIAVYKSDRTLVAPRVPNYDCSSRTLYPVDVDGVKISADDLLDFSSTPLSSKFLEEFVTFKSRGDRNLPPISATLPFDVDHHPAAKKSKGCKCHHEASQGRC